MNPNNNSAVSEYSDKLVKDIVLQVQGSAEVFEKYGIDFCCGGNRTLQSACEKKGINTEDVETDLAKATMNRADALRFDSWELDFLANYIVNNHHSYVKNAIPGTLARVQKINAVHGERHPFLAEVENSYKQLSQEMISHMRKEEDILFPMINTLATAKREGRKVENVKRVITAPINMMELEHDQAGALTEKIRELTSNYTLPADACTTFALAYKELQEFERDLHKHVFLENNILFPKAIILENELLA